MQATVGSRLAAEQGLSGLPNANAKSLRLSYAISYLEAAKYIKLVSAAVTGLFNFQGGASLIR